MDKLTTVADALGEAVKVCVRITQADIGVFVFAKGDALGLAIGGDKNKINQETKPFLIEAIKRFQTLIDAIDHKKISLNDKCTKFINAGNENFIPMDEPRPEDN